MFVGCPAAPKGCVNRSHFTRRFDKTLRTFQHQTTKPYATALPISSELPSARHDSINLPVAQIYTSQAYTHKRALGPVRLDIIQGKGLGWRARRDIATGELLFVSLPLIVLYGPPDEPPENDELTAALRSSWPRLTSLERRWLQLLAECAAASTQPSTVSSSGRPTVTSTAPAAAVGEPPHVRHSPPPLDTLLARARALVAEGTATTAAAAAEVSEQDHQSNVTITPTSSSSASTSSSHNLSRSTHATDSSLQDTPIPESSLVEAQPLLPRLFSIPSTATATTTPTNSPSGSGVGANGVSEGGHDVVLLRDLVTRYSYSELHQDPAVGELMDLGDVSAVGLWPEAALLNHSCAPNTVSLLVGGAMYLRAGRPVLAGEELCLSYMGKGVFRHVAERRVALRSSHGFLCSCPRCIAEQEQFPTHRFKDLEKQQQQQQQQQRRQQQRNEHCGKDGTTENAGGMAGKHHQQEVEDGKDEVLDDAVLAASLLGRRRGGGSLQAALDAVFGVGRFRTTAAEQPTLLAAANAALDSEWAAAVQAALTAPSRPRQQQLELLARLEGFLEQVDAACADLDLPPRGHLMMMASVYGVVRLTCELAELSGGTVTPQRRLQLLKRAAEVLEAVAPGSDLHAAATIMVAGVARRVYGSSAPEARRAELTAASAHVARYGRELLQLVATEAGAGGEAAGLLRRIMDTRRRLVTGSGLVAAMSVMAWAEQVGSQN